MEETPALTLKCCKEGLASLPVMEKQRCRRVPSRDGDAMACVVTFWRDGEFLIPSLLRRLLLMSFALLLPIYLTTKRKCSPY